MASKAKKQAATRPRYKVVIVEDSPLQRRRLEIALATQQFDVATAENGQEALDRMRSDPPDLLITDIMMPEMDGFELCQAVRNDPLLQLLPVIVVTTLSSPQDVIQALECGADAFLPKPYSDKALFARIDSILAYPDRKRNTLTQETATFLLEGKDVTVSYSHQRLFDLLLSAYSAAVDKGHDLSQVNQELRSIKETLEELNEDLDQKVRERTEQIKQLLDQERLIGEVLSILNRRDGWEVLVSDILETIQTATGLEAVAVRLEHYGDFPYSASRGFPPEFILTEKYLVDQDGAGLPKRDESGKKELACMCGNVICGRTDPVHSFFTEYGSFWSNCTTELLASTTETERQSPTRNQCNAFGYESVALIPIRSEGSTIGLLQLNDRRTDRFDVQTIQFFEEIAGSVGVAYRRQQAEGRYKVLFESNMAGVYVTGVDGRFIACNLAFAKMLGYTSPEEILRLQASELYFNAADHEGFRDELFDAKQIVGRESCLRRKNGKAIWVIESCSLNPGRDGDGPTLLGTAVDVTVLRETEAALRERVKELTCLFRVNHELQKDSALDDLVRFVGELLGPGMSWPDKTLTRVELAGEVFSSEGYADDLLSGIDADICRDGTSFGYLSVRYAEALPFLPEEQDLLATLAGDVCMWYERTQAKEKLVKALEGTIRAVGMVAEMKDAYTAGHQRRVAELAVAIARGMELPDNAVEEIRVAAMIHDIGKMAVPSEILSKPGKLSSVEFSLIKEHSQTAYNMLSGVEFPEPVPTLIVQHHERMDGSGYPNGLKGEVILVGARIIAIADVVEAMASHRPYRAALGIDVALEEIDAHKGERYDPQASDACIALFREKGFAFSQ